MRDRRLQKGKARAGAYVLQPTGYKAFIPKPLPPNPPIAIDQEMLELLSSADRALGRLDGVSETLPNPDLFVAMYVRKEAVLSSQIEGTQASLIDVLEYEAETARRGLAGDVQEVVNYVRAMNHGLQRLATLPLSLRLIREIHEQLLMGVRGSDRRPGEFRQSQNWVGPAGYTLEDAIFVPPPAWEVEHLMGELELFLHSQTPLPPLIKCGLIHSQFETIHPFLDGNGRMGRLLITFFLCQQGVLKKPLLYLSLYLARQRAQYYQHLQAVRDEGDWEGWLKFFLRGIAEVSRQATETARRILELREEHRERVSQRVARSANALRLLELLYASPIISMKMAANAMGVSFPTANTLIEQFRELGLLREITGRARDRLFQYDAYLALL